MTLLYVCLSIFPIIEVKSSSAFTFKITIVIVLANSLGAGVFFVGKRKRVKNRPERVLTTP